LKVAVRKKGFEKGIDRFKPGKFLGPQGPKEKKPKKKGVREAQQGIIPTTGIGRRIQKKDQPRGGKKH